VHDASESSPGNHLKVHQKRSPTGCLKPFGLTMGLTWAEGKAGKEKQVLKNWETVCLRCDCQVRGTQTKQHTKTEFELRAQKTRKKT